jgi:LPXTG-motif cell wall-anchored protein
MAFENTNIENQAVTAAAPLQGVPANRTYRITAAVLGGIALLALGGIIVYALVFLPQKRSQREQQIQALMQQNTQVALAITETSAVVAAAPTSAPTTAVATRPPDTSTPAPSATAVILQPTGTRAPTRDPRTATVAALFTQAAHVTQTVVPTPTELPQTGFADKISLPAWLGLAALFVGMFFLARQLRTGV